jgi:hypothetical protein
MFILDGRSLALDTPFTTWDGTQYPANWLRLASPEERSNIGIYESIDPIPYDQAFYWGWDNDNKLIPKDHAQLVQQWVATVKQTANTLLANTGWYIERLNDPSSGKPVPQSVLDRRAEIRDLSNAKEDASERALERGASQTGFAPGGASERLIQLGYDSPQRSASVSGRGEVSHRWHAGLEL